MTAFKGDIGQLGLVGANLAKLASVPSQTAREAANGIREAIRQEFSEGQDPYGRSWAALAQATLDRGRTPPPLTDSGDMADVDVHPAAGAGIEIEFGPEYAGFHQTGTRNMPARPPLPTGGFPTTWAKVISDAAAKQFRKAV